MHPTRSAQSVPALTLYWVLFTVDTMCVRAVHLRMYMVIFWVFVDCLQFEGGSSLILSTIFFTLRHAFHLFPAISMESTENSGCSYMYCVSSQLPSSYFPQSHYVFMTCRAAVLQSSFSSNLHHRHLFSHEIVSLNLTSSSRTAIFVRRPSCVFSKSWCCSYKRTIATILVSILPEGQILQEQQNLRLRHVFFLTHALVNGRCDLVSQIRQATGRE